MKIGIDISQIVYGTGVSCYTENLVDSLLKIDQKNEYLFFGSSLRLKPALESALASVQGHYEKKFYSFPPIFLERLWNQLHILEIEKFIGKVDLFHSSDWLEPPAQCPKVTTIHDLAIFKFPETFSPKGGHSIVDNLKRKFYWVKRESTIIIAVSESTKKDIISILGIPEEKIRVIYEAPHGKVKKVSSREIRKVKNKFKIKGDYLLSVSTLEPRKNLQRIIEAHKILNNKDLTLVLVGKIGWGKSLKFGHNTILTGFVSNEELSAFYSGASALLYPSLYEGFGQNILEGMVCGCPVVTSNVSSMPEVAGEAAVLVDPLSVESIADGIKKALESREDLIKRGYQQVKKFSWEKCARETLKVYEETVK